MPGRDLIPAAAAHDRPLYRALAVGLIWVAAPAPLYIWAVLELLI